MFENLASSNQYDEFPTRKGPYQRTDSSGNSSQHFPANSPSKSTASVPFVSSYLSSSPRSAVSAPFQQAKVRPMPYGGASPRTINSNTGWERPTQYSSSPRNQAHVGESRERPFVSQPPFGSSPRNTGGERPTQYRSSPRNQVHIGESRERPSVSQPAFGSSPRNRSPSSALDKPSLNGVSPRTGNTPLDWPGEEVDSIPTPLGLRRQCSPGKNHGINAEFLKPVILPSRNPLELSPLHSALHNRDFRSPKHLKPQNPNPASGSPLKALQNKEHHFKTQSPILSKHFMKLQNQTVDPSEIIKSRSKHERKVSEKNSFEDLPQDRSINSDCENNAPESYGGKTKSSRALRLIRAKHSGTTSPSPTVESALKQSLDAAKVVMEEERSSGGSSSASNRSSLSHQELSDIASRAMKLAEDKPGSLRGSRTITKVSHHDARIALLAAATKRKGKEAAQKPGDENEDRDVTERLGAMAKRAVAMKKGSKSMTSEVASRSLDIATAPSNDSNRSRRLEHPAFAARATPNAKQKTSSTRLTSVDILTSFRQFSASRSNPALLKGKCPWTIEKALWMFWRIFRCHSNFQRLLVFRKQVHCSKQDGYFESCQ
jgi:hypothetical protein